MPVLKVLSLGYRPAACLLLIASLNLAGCASLGTKSDSTGAEQSSPEVYQQHLASIAPIKNFALEGRIAVQTDGRGVSGSLHWQHINDQDYMSLFSPMGGKMAEVHTSADNVTLTSTEGKTYSAVDAETLTEQALGWRMPVRNLSDWIIGRPARNNPASGDTEQAANTVEKARWDSEGKLTKLYQDGWEINYLEYRMVNGQQLPSKLTLRNTKLYIKFIVERWNIVADKQSSSLSARLNPVIAYLPTR